tara:strand:+ start:1479 stop:1940 length:462 start_codon:yes stop_codon:yes gene_type:complete
LNENEAMKNELKTKTCKRCNGTGQWSKTHPRSHLGTRGGCFQCDCTGELFWVSREVIDGYRRKCLASHLQEVEDLAASAKVAADKTIAYAKIKYPKSVERRERRFEERLAKFREQWKEIKTKQNNFKPSKKGKWVSNLDTLYRLALGDRKNEN